MATNPLTNLGGIKNDIIVKLGVDTTQAYYTDTILNDWINNAHKWAASYKKWPFTEGRYSTTSTSMGTSEDGYTVLEYPEGFRSDTIRLLTIGGKRFQKKNFYKFQSFLEDNSGDSGKIYSDFARRVYINPNASSLSGSVVAWGQIFVADLDGTDPTSLTVFSTYDELGNQAIVEEVLSYAAERERQNVGIVRGKIAGIGPFHHGNATAILDQLFESIADEQYGYQDVLDEGMYKRFDVLRGGFKEDIFKRDQWYS